MTNKRTNNIQESGDLEKRTKSNTKPQIIKINTYLLQDDENTNEEFYDESDNLNSNTNTNNKTQSKPNEESTCSSIINNNTFYNKNIR